MSRLDALDHDRPEWRPWLQVLRVVVDELRNPAWDASLSIDAPSRTAPPTAAAPWLAVTGLRPDGEAIARLLHRLTTAARAQGLHAMVGDDNHDAAQAASAGEATTLFLAVLEGDHARLQQQASRIGASTEGLRALVELLPMPYLHACARQWAASPGPPWSQGYCPVCAAWPAFAEIRGIERARHLRCGRCGAGWPMPALACTYCATTNHDTLGTLVVDDKKSRFSLDICGGCSGYLKSCTTLQATPSDEILATDLASVEFDLAAVERGFHRPPGPDVARGASLAFADLARSSVPRRP